MLTSVALVLGARAPRVLAASCLARAVALFLLAPSARVLASAIARARRPLVLFLLGALASDPAVHFLDKRLRARRALAAAAHTGDVALMETLYATFACLIDEEMVLEAVRGRQRAAVLWLDAQLVPPAQSDPPAGHQPAYSAGERRQFFSGRAVRLAVENGDLDMLQLLLALRARGVAADDGGRRDGGSLPLLAARHGHGHIVEWLGTHFALPPGGKLDDEVHTGPYGATGRLLPCLHCRQSGRHRAEPAGRTSCTQWRMDLAASRGRLADVQWFHEHRSEHGCSSGALEDAAANGHLAVVRWLLDNRVEGDAASAMDKAAANGHLEIVQCLHAARSVSCSRHALVSAAAGGHWAVVKWILGGAQGAVDRGRKTSSAIRVTATVVDAAAGSGHLEMLQLLFGLCKGCKCYALGSAAAHNHQVAVRWLLEQRCSACDADAVTSFYFQGESLRLRTRVYFLVVALLAAAKNGHLDTARLVLASAEPDATAVMSRIALQQSAQNGHLGVVKWAARTLRRCGVTDAALFSALSAALEEATKRRHTAVIRWIRLQSPALDRLTPSRAALQEAMVSAAEHADFDTLQWAAERYSAPPQVLRQLCVSATRRGHLEVVQWLSLLPESADAWGRDKCTLAARGNGHVSLHKWLSWSRDRVGPV